MNTLRHNLLLLLPATGLALLPACSKGDLIADNTGVLPAVSHPGRKSFSF